MENISKYKIQRKPFEKSCNDCNLKAHIDTSALWDFVDSYYRNNWFLKAFGDLSFTSKDYFFSILLSKGLKQELFQIRQLIKAMSPYW